MREHLSSLEIDELAAAIAADDRVRDHLAACARCRDDLAAAESTRAEFVRSVFPRTVGRLAPRRRWWRLGFLAIPAIAVLALVLWQPRDPPPEQDIAIKGGPTFRVFARRGDSVFPVRDATHMAPGDQIRFVAGSRDHAYLMVASIDGAGTVTIYYPYGGDHSGAANADARELPGSIVLDRAPGPERVFALFSARPLDAAPVTRALHELGARGADAIRSTRSLDLPCVQASIVFEKDLP